MMFNLTAWIVAVFTAVTMSTIVSAHPTGNTNFIPPTPTASHSVQPATWLYNTPAVATRSPESTEHGANFERRRPKKIHSHEVYVNCQAICDPYFPLHSIDFCHRSACINDQHDTKEKLNDEQKADLLEVYFPELAAQLIDKWRIGQTHTMEREMNEFINTYQDGAYRDLLAD